MARKTAQEGKEAALERSTAALSPQLKETAYAWAAAMVSANGNASPEGAAFLNALRERLQNRVKPAEK